MKFFPKNARLPQNTNLLLDINDAAEKLYEKLIHLNLDNVDLSEYNKKYFSKKVKQLKRELQKYSYLLSLSLEDSKIPYNKFVLVDYGGGSGMFSLLAAELGISKVIYNDIYDKSVKDIKSLTQQLNMKISDFICGDIEDLISYLRVRKINVNCITSYDVIEHIYDIEYYFESLPLISKQEFTIVFGSGANNHNFLIRKKLQNFHNKVEFKNRKKEIGYKDRDSLLNYLTIRKNIIKTQNSKLTTKEVNMLSKASRGLIKKDIIALVSEYDKTRKISYMPNHPTNTCDPLTGNWAEHLMDTEYLKKLLEQQGIETQIKCGYFGNVKTFWPLFNFINLLIAFFGKYGLFLSPYYILKGKKI